MEFNEGFLLQCVWHAPELDRTSRGLTDPIVCISSEIPKHMLRKLLLKHFKMLMNGSRLGELAWSGCPVPAFTRRIPSSIL